MRKMFLGLMLALLFGITFALPDYTVAIVPSNATPTNGTPFLVTTYNSGSNATGYSYTFDSYGGYHYIPSGIPQFGQYAYTVWVPCTFGQTAWLNATADIFNNIAESNEGNNAAVGSRTCNQPGGLADLTISSITYTNFTNGGNTYYNITVVTSNIGIGASIASITRTLLNNGNPSDINVLPLAPNSFYYGERIVPCTPSVQWIDALADNTSVVNESNENNNHAYLQLPACPVQQLPDYISNISINVTNTTPGYVTYLVTTSNVGNAAGTVSSFTNANPSGGQSVNRQVPALGVGSSWTFNVGLACTQGQGTSITSAADVNNAIAESNEGNNLNSMSYTCPSCYVLGHTCASNMQCCSGLCQAGVCANPAPSPDYIPQLSFNRSNDTTVVFNVRTYNQGAAAFSASMTSYSGSGGYAGSWQVPALGQYYSNMQQVVADCPAPGGSASISVTVDSNNNIIESNESNNIATLSGSCTHCIENWTCGNWGACVNGIQTRTCTDQNNCGTIQNRPPITQACASCRTIGQNCVGAVCCAGLTCDTQFDSTCVNTSLPDLRAALGSISTYTSNGVLHYMMPMVSYNMGPGASGAYVTRVTYGSSVTDYPIPAQANGATNTNTLDVACGATDTTLTASANYNHAVTETRYTNNIVSRVIGACSGSGCRTLGQTCGVNATCCTGLNCSSGVCVNDSGVSGGPDLVIPSITIPSSMAPGNQYVGAIVTKNSGKKPSAASVTSIAYDGREIASIAIPALAAGAQSSNKFSISCTGTEKSPTLVATADATGANSESNKANNVRSGAIKCVAAAPKPTAGGTVKPGTTGGNAVGPAATPPAITISGITSDGGMLTAKVTDSTGSQMSDASVKVFVVYGGKAVSSGTMQLDAATGLYTYAVKGLFASDTKATVTISAAAKGAKTATRSQLVTIAGTGSSELPPAKPTDTSGDIKPAEKPTSPALSILNALGITFSDELLNAICAGR